MKFAPTRKSLRKSRFAILCLIISSALPGVRGQAAEGDRSAGAAIDFVRDIQPIFRDHCYSCHGGTKQKGSLRLDHRKKALEGGSSGPAIVPKESSKSPLITLVITTDEDERMPQNAPALSQQEIDLLRAWIDQGAVWPDGVDAEWSPAGAEHWAFKPPVRPALPTVKQTAWPRNALDLFILARLEKEGLTPSPEADRRSLIRRLFFDVIGLPPSPEEVEAFVRDTNPDAYERLVERLLGSPQYGERWARHWLDVVRFAETHGFEMNQPRPNAWRYRDYVIRAFNEDKPYNQFIREQIAGDALGEDIATGFLVAGPWDQVKSPDEVLTRNQRADELHDIVNTTGTAFLGLTLGCARCHDHKFDPIPQRDYFAVKAVFEGVQHGERPIRTPESEQNERRVRELRGELRVIEEKLADYEPFAEPEPAENAARRSAVNPRKTVDRFDPVEAKFVRFTILETVGAEPCLDELEIFTATPREGNSTRAAVRNVALASGGAKATASGTYPGNDFHKLEHLNDGRYGNERSWISNENGKGWVQVELPQVERIDRVVWSRDRSPNPRFADRLVTRYRIETSLDGEHWKLVASEADRNPYDASAKPAETDSFAGLAPNEAETARQMTRKKGEIEAEISRLSAVEKTYSGEFKEPEPTRRWHRGDPMAPREVVLPGALTEIASGFSFPTLSTNTPERERRVALAEWMASPENPLTARVLVNRIWLYHFGEGLVSTPSDFGLNGAKPSHSELLDWLASEFVNPAASGTVSGAWSIKSLHRLILTSAAYRQSSVARAEGLAADAEARLLWRFPPRRLDAEAIRDAVVAIAGKLDARMGGPGWSPFEPNDNYVRVYLPKSTFAAEDFRRMVYATAVRQRLDGVFGAFDCPDGGQIAPKRTRSTTPLQALNLLNSGFAMQMAGLFAERLEREAGAEPAARIRRAFALAFNREPDHDELAAAESFVREQGLKLFCRAILNANELIYVF